LTLTDTALVLITPSAVPVMVIDADVGYEIPLNVARPDTAFLVVVPPNIPPLETTVIALVSVVLLPYWSSISIVKVPHVEPAMAVAEGSITQFSEYAVEAVILKLVDVLFKSPDVATRV